MLGVVTQTAFRRAAQTLGLTLTESEVRTLLEHLDVAAGGGVDYYQFCRLAEMDEVGAQVDIGESVACFHCV
jgi:Ca2+-binding EF-hand superfamily protein